MPAPTTSPAKEPVLAVPPDATKPDVIAHIRRVASRPTVLAEFLQDPAVVASLAADDARDDGEHRRSQSNSHTHSSPRRRRSPRNSPSLLGRVLAEEEKQAHQLKALLRSTSDRLEQEARRTAQAEARADFAEARARDLAARVRTADAAKYTGVARTPTPQPPSCQL